MDLHIVTLEITTLIIGFDHYDALVSYQLSHSGELNEEYQKIRDKGKEHLNVFFGDAAFYDETGELKSLSTIKETIKTKLAELKTKEIHDLVEKLEKDAKKMRKLYKALQE